MKLIILCFLLLTGCSKLGHIIAENDKNIEELQQLIKSNNANLKELEKIESDFCKTNRSKTCQKKGKI